MKRSAVVIAAVCAVFEPVAASNTAGTSHKFVSSVFSLRHSGRTSQAQHDEYPSCSCDCCDTVARRADEIVDGVAIKCVPSEGHSDQSCPAQCTAADDDRVLQTAQDRILDYQRFCFFECKPEAGASSPATTQCIALSEDDVQQLVDGSGNARDPAQVYGTSGAKRLALAARAAVLRARSAKTAALAQAPDLMSEADAKQSAMRGRLWSVKEGGDARDEAAATREQEADAAIRQLRDVAEAAVAPASEMDDAGGEENANDEAQQKPAPAAGGVLAEIREATAGAGAASEGAAAAAEMAVEAFKQARKSNWEAAIEAARAEMGKVKEQAAAKAKADKEWQAKLVSDSAVKASLAAAKASEPYFVSMLRAQQSARDYTSRANQMAAKAMGLDSEAKKIAKEANSLNRAKQHSAAQAKIMDAQDEAKQSQALAKQARQLFDTADEITRTIPMYQAAASAAAARAAYDSNPMWAPR